MSKILLLASLAITAASIAYGQPAATVELEGMGGFNNTYSYVRTDVVSGAPDGYDYDAFVYSAGPTVTTGIPQFSMVIYENQQTGQRFLASLSDRQAPWSPTATIAWKPDGSRMYATGYAVDLDDSAHSISWEGGGMGPAYGNLTMDGSSDPTAEPSATVQEATAGLTYKDGTFIPIHSEED